MSYRPLFHSTDPQHPTSSITTFSSSSSSLFHSNSPRSHDQSFVSRNSLLQSPTISAIGCHVANSRINDLSSHRIHQPQSNPHQHFLNRSVATCPTHLTGRQRTNWLKAGLKAQRNEELMTSLHLPIYIFI